MHGAATVPVVHEIICVNIVPMQKPLTINQWKPHEKRTVSASVKFHPAHIHKAKVKITMKPHRVSLQIRTDAML